jgi:hypothetical protein
MLLLVYTNDHASETVKELYNSDSCPGQNRNHVAARFLATLVANGQLNKIFQYFPVKGPCDRDSGLTEKVLHEIDMVNTPEEYHKLIEQSSRKGKFSVTVCNDNFSIEYIWWWPKFYK